MGYHSLFDIQQGLLKEYEADKIRTSNEVTFKEEELKKKEKWYMIHFWEIWSDELPNLREQIGKLKHEVARIEDLIGTAKKELTRLEDSKKRTATAQALVESHKDTIQNLQDQIG